MHLRPICRSRVLDEAAEVLRRVAGDGEPCSASRAFTFGYGASLRWRCDSALRRSSSGVPAGAEHTCTYSRSGGRACRLPPWSARRGAVEARTECAKRDQAQCTTLICGRITGRSRRKSSAPADPRRSLIAGAAFRDRARGRRRSSRPATASTRPPEYGRLPRPDDAEIAGFQGWALATAGQLLHVRRARNVGRDDQHLEDESRRRRNQRARSLQGYCATLSIDRPMASELQR